MEMILLETEENMQKVITLFKDYLNKVRTGRASASMLSGVMVDFYGTPTPIEQTSQISAPEPQQLLIKPYDKGQIGNIVGGINKADLGVNPMPEADVIRINIPALTEEIRKDLVKKMMSELEQFKVRVRNIRRDSNENIKKSALPDDSKKDGEAQIQKLTDKYIIELDSLAKDKEKQLMTI